MDDQEQNHQIIHQLTRAVDKLADAFHLTKEVFSDNQTRYEALAHEIRKDQKKEIKRQRRDAWLIAMISIFGIGSSVIAASYWSYKEEKVSLQKTQIAQLYNQESIIQRKIDHQLKTRDILMDAMVNVRAIRDEGQDQCVNGSYAGTNPIGYKQKLFSDSYKLLGAVFKTKGVFHNQNVQDQITHFLHLANVNKEICLKNSATDKELMSIQIEINKLIVSDIDSLQEKANKLSESLNQKK